MSTVSYTAVAHILIYGVAALATYAGFRGFVLRGRVTAFTACTWYLIVLLLLPSLLARALATLTNYLFTSEIVAPEAAWDVGLAMTLFLSTWICYFVGVLAGCIGSWSLIKNSPSAA
jgi:hypothetical protein